MMLALAALLVWAEPVSVVPVLEPVTVPEALVEPVSELDLEPVSVAWLPDAVVPEPEEPVAVDPSMGKKWELKQACWQSVYFLVSARVPFP